MAGNAPYWSYQSTLKFTVVLATDALMAVEKRYLCPPITGIIERIPLVPLAALSLP